MCAANRRSQVSTMTMYDLRGRGDSDNLRPKASEAGASTRNDSSTSWRSQEAERYRQKPPQCFCLVGFVPASSVQLQSVGLQSIFRSKRSRCKKACSLRSPILLWARARKTKCAKHPLGKCFQFLLLWVE